MRTGWIAVFVFSTLAACMPSRGTRAPQSNSAGDAASEATDTSAIESPEVATEAGPSTPDTTAPVDHCAGVDCNDGDTCTTDRCDPATGQCSNVVLTAPDPELGKACETDTDCWNGPCGRVQCLDFGCFKACADDVEVDLYCQDECARGEVTALDALEYDSRVIVRGKVAMADIFVSCEDSLDSRCEGVPELVDGDGSAILVDASVSWSCVRTALEPASDPDRATQCDPVARGGTYRVWGSVTGVAENDLMLSRHAIEVSDFCLETGPSLVGVYGGTYRQSDGELTFRAQILEHDGGYVLTIEANPLSQRIPPRTVPIDIGSGYVDVALRLPFAGGERDLDLRLYSNRNRLIGGHHDTQPINGVYPFGELELERLQGGWDE